MNELDNNVTVMFIGVADEDLYKSSMEKKGQMKVNISFEDLGYLEILIDLEILAVAQFNEWKMKHRQKIKLNDCLRICKAIHSDTDIMLIHKINSH